MESGGVMRNVHLFQFFAALPQMKSPLFRRTLVPMCLAAWVLVACGLAQGILRADADRLEWKSLDAAIESPAGRVFAAQGALILGIGGLDKDGRATSTVDIYEVNTDGTVSESRAELSHPVAFAGGTSHGNRVFLVGGWDGEQATSRVLSLEWRNGKLIEEFLPELPSPRVLAGAAVHRSTTRYYLYSIGGTPSLEEPKALDDVLELLVVGGMPGDEIAWTAKPDLPQGGRIAPMCEETFNEIVVVGGYSVEGEGGTERLRPTTDVWGYARIPRDGQQEPGWRLRPPLGAPIARAAVARSGQSHLLFLGGDASSGTLEEVFFTDSRQHSVNTIRSYHALTATWVDLDTMPTASFGGALAATSDNGYFVLGARGNDGEAIAAAQISFPRSTRHLQFFDYAVMVGFLLVMVGQGVWFGIKKKTVQTYAVGGGSMKWWATALSMAATGVSSISFMALPTLVASMGPVAVVGALMIIPGTLVSAYITFPMLRRLKVVSIFAYLEQRFGTSLRIVGSFKAIATTLLGRIGIVILLPSLAISSMTGLDSAICILAIGLITTIYSAAGGFEAVVWTDVIQGLMLFSGFVLLGVLAFRGIPDGWQGLVSTAQTLERDTFFIVSTNPILPSIWFIILGGVLGMMSFPGDQATAQRVLATPLRDVRRFAFSFGGLSIFVSGLTLFIGLCLLAYFHANPEELSPVMKNDQMVPIFMVQNIPVGIAGFLLAAIFAASMSTVSSGVNSCAVLFAEDFYRRLFKNSTPAREVWVMRIGTVITGLLGTAAALWLLKMPMPTLWETFMRIMALLGGGFGGVFILGFITQRTHSLGAIIGVLASVLVAYLLQFGSLDIHWSTLGSLITLSCVLVGYFSSLVIPWEKKDLTGLTVWNLVKAKVTDEELPARAEVGEA